MLDGPNYKHTTDCLMLSAMAPSRPSSASSASCMSDEVAVRNLPKELAQLPCVRMSKWSYNDQERSTPPKPSTAREVTCSSVMCIFLPLPVRCASASLRIQ